MTICPTWEAHHVALDYAAQAVKTVDLIVLYMHVACGVANVALLLHGTCTLLAAFAQTPLVFTSIDFTVQIRF